MMLDIEYEVSTFRKEADRDFIGLWHIASDIQNAIGSDNQNEIRRYTLRVVKGLMERNVYPGDYTLETLQGEGFIFWPGTPDNHIRRINDEWVKMGKTPNLENSICWFALRSK